MDLEDAHYHKPLKFEYRQIISNEETNRGYIHALMSIVDGLRLINQ